MNDFNKIALIKDCPEQRQRFVSGSLHVMQISPNRVFDSDWIVYLKQSGIYERYEGMCACTTCREIREGYFRWRRMADIGAALSCNTKP